MHYGQMQTHPDIIRKAGSPEAVAAKLGVSVHTVRSWLQRERIPVERWGDFVDAKFCSTKELLEGQPPRKQRDAAA